MIYFGFNHTITLFFLFILFTWSPVYTKSACIIIHGTWASGESWYRQGGDFFEAIAATAQEFNFVDEVISFSWDGKLGNLAQIAAGKKLAHVIDSYQQVILIGHSHGATVGIIASQFLAKKYSTSGVLEKIAQFYALGVPVDPTGDLYPDMLIVGKFYNLFSFGDYIQPINLAYNRIFTDHNRVFNISVQLDGLHPGHSQLHHPAIAKDLLKIERYFASKKINNFEHFSCDDPGLIHFFSYGLPRYEIQYDQKQLIELDERVHYLATKAFLRSPQEGKQDK